jgi:high-affinity iron transporter
VILGALSGLAVAFAIGAAFLAVFYTQANDLYGKAEELWEGIFCLIAVLLITPMSLAILRADKSRAKWQKKLRSAFSPQTEQPAVSEAPSSDAAHSPVLEKSHSGGSPGEEKSNEAATLPTLATSAPPAKRSLITRTKELFSPLAQNRRGAAAIFFIPFVTTLREGLEGVVFIGGVSLGLPASSIPLPAIVGIAVGLLCGWLIFRAGTVGKHVRM